jgi:hypothetical protein
MAPTPERILAIIFDVFAIVLGDEAACRSACTN